MKPVNQPIVTCPYCGAEYMPCEIFYPDITFGKPENIIKDKENGKILHIIGDGFNADENYDCDYCNKRFTVHLDVKCVSKKDELHSFNGEYITKIKEHTEEV